MGKVESPLDFMWHLHTKKFLRFVVATQAVSFANLRHRYNEPNKHQWYNAGHIWNYKWSFVYLSSLDTELVPLGTEIDNRVKHASFAKEALGNEIKTS